MKKTLIIVARPNLDNSKVNKRKNRRKCRKIYKLCKFYIKLCVHYIFNNFIIIHMARKKSPCHIIQYTNINFINQSKEIIFNNFLSLKTFEIQSFS